MSTDNNKQRAEFTLRPYKLREVEAREIDAAEPDLLGLDALDHVPVRQLGLPRGRTVGLLASQSLIYVILQAL